MWEGLSTSGHVSICACVCVWIRVRHCIRSPWVFSVCLCCSWAQSSRRGDCETMGTGITDGGRGVNGQAAGYPITFGVLLLRPLPLTLPSSWIQEEVKRGQASSSLCHYPSITCRPLCADNRTFSSVSFLLTYASGLYGPHPLILSVWHCLYDFRIISPLHLVSSFPLS